MNHGPESVFWWIKNSHYVQQRLSVQKSPQELHPILSYQLKTRRKSSSIGCRFSHHKNAALHL